MSKNYFESVAFPELEKPVETKLEISTTILVSKHLDEMKDQTLRMIRAIESGDSNIAPARQVEKNLPFWTAFNRFYGNPSAENMSLLFKITEQDLGRRFRLEMTNIFMNFEDVKDFIKNNKIGIL